LNDLFCLFLSNKEKRIKFVCCCCGQSLHLWIKSKNLTKNSLKGGILPIRLKSLNQSIISSFSNQPPQERSHFKYRLAHAHTQSTLKCIEYWDVYMFHEQDQRRPSKKGEYEYVLSRYVPPLKDILEVYHSFIHSFFLSFHTIDLLFTFTHLLFALSYLFIYLFLYDICYEWILHLSIVIHTYIFDMSLFWRKRLKELFLSLSFPL
jgi:hypothetical protein